MSEQRDLRITDPTQEIENTQPLGSLRPLIYPEVFTGDEDFSEWIQHFESVAVVNGWDDVTKLQWMHVRVTGKARVALARAKAESYKRAREALQERFEPSTKKELYKIKIRSRMKKPTETWGDFADELCVLADKAYPELQEKSRDYIALNCYLEQLRDPRINFEVRQRRPKTVSEAVTATLELESCLIEIRSCHDQGNNEVSEQRRQSIQVNNAVVADDITKHITVVLEELTEKLEKLEHKIAEREKSHKQKGRLYHQQTQKQPQEVICHKCNQPGHYARGCASAVAISLQANAEALPLVDQVCHSDDAIPHNNACTIAINSVSNYSVCANVFGSRVSFLVDTGAAVSLVSSEVWDRVKPTNAPRLNHVDVNLVGVDGTPLQVQGSVTVELEMSGQIFVQELIVANTLTSEGILGLNFLEANECVVDLSRGEMCSRGAKVSLHAKGFHQQAAQVEVVLPETFTIAATSEMEVLGMMPESCERVWMMETNHSKNHRLLWPELLLHLKMDRFPSAC